MQRRPLWAMSWDVVSTNENLPAFRALSDQQPGIDFTTYIKGGTTMLKAVDLRKGKTIIYEGTIYTCQDSQTVAKGNKKSYKSAKLKNLKSGTIIEVRFRVDEMLEVPFVESKVYEYLFTDGTEYTLMDLETFDQIAVSGDLFGEAVQFLKPNEKVTAQIVEGEMIGIELPHTVVLRIVDTPPVVKGATATNQPKDAVLETGAKVRVPVFMGPDEDIVVDTRTGEYIERAK